MSSFAPRSRRCWTIAMSPRLAAAMRGVSPLCGKCHWNTHYINCHLLISTSEAMFGLAPFLSSSNTTSSLQYSTAMWSIVHPWKIPMIPLLSHTMSYIWKTSHNEDSSSWFPLCSSAPSLYPNHLSSKHSREPDSQSESRIVERSMDFLFLLFKHCHSHCLMLFPCLFICSKSFLSTKKIDFGKKKEN